MSGSAGSGADIGGAGRGTGAGLRIATRPITADAALSSPSLARLMQPCTRLGIAEQTSTP